MSQPVNRTTSATRRAIIPTLALTGVSAALAAAALPAAGVAHPGSARHEQAAGQRVLVRGLVTGHHRRTLMVFAKTAVVGGATRHNQHLTITFAQGSHGRVKIPTGDLVHLDARGRADGRHLRIDDSHGETVSSMPATLIVGSISAINGNLLTVAEQDRDNGDHADGDDHGHDGGGDVSRAQPSDHSPGGPGGPSGSGGGDGPNNSGHQIVIDDSVASVTVDGPAGTLVVGDTVAVLGEAANNSVTASTIDAFTTAPAFLRGGITAISGDDVTIGDDDNGGGGGDAVRDHGGDNDTSMTVSLTGVPLALNGDIGATTSDLVLGDKIVVLGPADSTTGQITPEVAFAFNDNDNNPCGDNRGHGGGGDD